MGLSMMMMMMMMMTTRTTTTTSASSYKNICQYAFIQFYSQSQTVRTTSRCATFDKIAVLHQLLLMCTG
jgi:hypothetical protein